MDESTNEQREPIKRVSTERLRVKLLQSGADEEKVFALDRNQLMNAAATLIIANPERATGTEKKSIKRA